MRQLIKTDDVYRVCIKDIAFDKGILVQILNIGLPSGLQNSIISIANVVVQANINAFGSAAMAGCGAYFKIEGFVFLPITCFSMALTTFISQNLGAGQTGRVKKGACFGIACGLGLAELIGVIVFIFIPQLVRLFDSHAAVMDYGILQAHTESLFYFLLAFSHIAAGILRGAGRSAVPMFVMLACWCIIRITYVTIVTGIIPKIQVVFWAYPITWSLSSIVFLFYMFKVDWMHKYTA